MTQVVEPVTFEPVDREARPELGSDKRLAIAVIVTGLVAYFGSVALEPPLHHEAGAWVAIADVGATVFLGLAFYGAYSLMRGRQRIGYAATTGAAWTLVALVVGCPASGHHTLGAWWGGQMALSLAFATVSTVAFKLQPRDSRPAAE